MIEIAKMAAIEDPQNALIEEIDSLFRPDVLHALSEGKDWRGAIHAVKKHCEKVIELCDKVLPNPVQRLALAMYAGEPCRICGRELTMLDVENDAVFAGYSLDNKSRAAHGECYRSGKPKKSWAYPDDALSNP